jgi:hypothetical protein
MEDQHPNIERPVVPPNPVTMTTDSGGKGPDTLLWIAREADSLMSVSFTP